MLGALRKIVEEVSSAKKLDEALMIIVRGVQRTLEVDSVSVYLGEQTENADKEWVLKATQGLKQKAIGKIRMRSDEGLVGLVAERAEAINLDDASVHPRFKYFPESGEEVFHSFLGAPVIQYGEVQGVLVVQQQTPRLFDEDQVAFLITLAAQLSGAISQASISNELSQSSRANVFIPRKDQQRIKGISGSPGVVIGDAVVVYAMEILEAVPDKPIKDTVGEIGQFEASIQHARADLKNIAESMREILPQEEAALFDAYEMMLDGGPLIDDTIEKIKAGNWAQGAFRQTIQEHVRVFMDVDDPYLKERAEDIKDLGKRVLMHMQDKAFEKQEYPEKTILVGDEISVTQLAEVPTEKLAGIVSAHGSGSSHVAILARAMQVPTVMGVANLPISRLNGRELIIDGYSGYVIIQPNWALRLEYSRLIKQEKQLGRELKSLVDEKATTKDGLRINLFANTGLISDLSPCLSSGAEGIGLYRTEIPFQIRDRFPSEEEQYDIYRQVLESFAPRPVVIRTLDIGGDKPLEYFPVSEDNPFLGWRGLRVTLDHPEIFLNQLKAILRANNELGNLRIMFPMLSSIRELHEAKKLLKQAHEEVALEGVLEPLPSIGVMIEVPSTIYLMDVLAQHVDFFSIGTNDLTQYLLAVDRNNERVAKLYDSLHPAVLHAILQVAETAKRHSKPLSVCGELAGDPLGALCLMGMGVHSLSMSAGSLLKVKKVIRHFSSEESQDIVSGVLTLEDGQAVRKQLTENLEQAGLGGLIRAGK